LIAERMPLFQGGDLTKFREWVQTRLRYPEEARKQGIQGRVVLTFVVERDGSVTETSVLQSPHQLLTTEALRIVRSSSGLWRPPSRRARRSA
ncbi:TonB protein, partial [human gut metagenome]